MGSKSDLPQTRATIPGAKSAPSGFGDFLKAGGAGGIRTLDRALQPYNGLANRRLQPLGHSSMTADMPDAWASRKRQIRGWRIRRCDLSGSELRTVAPGRLLARRLIRRRWFEASARRAATIFDPLPRGNRVQASGQSRDGHFEPERQGFLRSSPVAAQVFAAAISRDRIRGLPRSDGVTDDGRCDAIAVERCLRAPRCLASRRFRRRVDLLVRFGARQAREAENGARHLLTQQSFRQMRANRKSLYKTDTCEESAITIECYLCNTLPKTASNCGLPSRSFIACAGTFGNCDDATEGGIPRSSRLGGSLKSLAFMRECPKARSD